jgi:hypothetical protein
VETGILAPRIERIKMATTHRVHDIFRTKANKIRRAKKELLSNPNNSSVKKSLEFWETNDKKARNI